MHYLREFAATLRKLELKEPCISITNANITPILYEYVKKLDEVMLVQGEYHKYSEVIKHVVNKFLNGWSILLDEHVKYISALLNHTTTKNSLLEMLDYTVKLQQRKQNEFKEIFESEKTPEDQTVLDEVEDMYKARLKDLEDIKRTISGFETQDRINQFIDYHSELAIVTTNEIFAHTCTIIAMSMAQYTDQIAWSLQDIIKRLKKNLNEINQKSNEHTKELFAKLYELNKSRLEAIRMYSSAQRSINITEADSAIYEIQKKIERDENEECITRLEEEIEHREKNLAEFEEIRKSIKNLKEQLNEVTEYIQRYNKRRTIEGPGSKLSCWYNIGENFRQRQKALNDALYKASRALVSFFAVPDNIVYKDNISHYTIDKYGHQIYSFNYGKENYHLTCDGKYKEVESLDKYYFDNFGRHVLDEKGEKVYKCASCTSSYNLDENQLLVKITKDCGHSEKPNPKCGLQIKDPNVFEILPQVEPVDIKQTMTPEASKYLWDSFGHILPKVLCDTGTARPLNPILYIASRLLYYKYHKNTPTQMRENIEKSNKYRSNIHKRRKEARAATAKDYKSRQVQKRKPEESDDTEEQKIYAASTNLRVQNFSAD